jgi:hypothetical protein
MKEGADERDPPFFFQKPRDAIVPNAATVPYPSVTQNLFLLPTSNPAPEPSSRASARPKEIMIMRMFAFGPHGPRARQALALSRLKTGVRVPVGSQCLAYCDQLAEAGCDDDSVAPGQIGGSPVRTRWASTG